MRNILTLKYINKKIKVVIIWNIVVLHLLSFVETIYIYVSQYIVYHLIGNWKTMYYLFP